MGDTSVRHRKCRAARTSLFCIPTVRRLTRCTRARVSRETCGSWNRVRSHMANDAIAGRCPEWKVLSWSCSCRCHSVRPPDDGCQTAGRFHVKHRRQGLLLARIEAEGLLHGTLQSAGRWDRYRDLGWLLGASSISCDCIALYIAGRTAPFTPTGLRLNRTALQRRRRPAAPPGARFQRRHQAGNPVQTRTTNAISRQVRAKAG